MVLFTIDNYRIEKRNIANPRSNYNVAIDVYKDNELFSGYHDVSHVTDLQIITRFVETLEEVKRNENKTPEEYFS